MLSDYKLCYFELDNGMKFSIKNIHYLESGYILCDIVKYTDRGTENQDFGSVFFDLNTGDILRAVTFPDFNDEKLRYTNIKTLLFGTKDFENNIMVEVKKSSHNSDRYISFETMNGVKNILVVFTRKKIELMYI